MLGNVETAIKNKEIHISKQAEFGQDKRCTNNLEKFKFN